MRNEPLKTVQYRLLEHKAFIEKKVFDANVLNTVVVPPGFHIVLYNHIFLEGIRYSGEIFAASAIFSPGTDPYPPNASAPVRLDRRAFLFHIPDYWSLKTSISISRTVLMALAEFSYAIVLVSFMIVYICDLVTFPIFVYCPNFTLGV